MRLLSVNVSGGRTVRHLSKRLRTGIYKEPVAGRVMLRRLNLEGDAQSDLRVHGGIHKAVYAYPHEHYAVWARELGRQGFAYGQFGENFTVTEMLEDNVCIGDVFRVGGAVVEVTGPRIPCFKLGIKMESEKFPKLFLASGRVGFYLRVLEEGEVGAGDAILPLQKDPASFTVQELVRVAYFNRDDLVGARKALDLSALAPGWKQFFEERLGKRERLSR